MTALLTVPEWLNHKVAQWIDILSMREWEIAVGLALAPGNDPDCLGRAEQYPSLNFGRITFRVDIENNPEWEKTIVHELLHVKHCRIDHFVEEVMIPGMDGASVACSLTYRQFIEPFIYSMADSLVELNRGKIDTL